MSDESKKISEGRRSSTDDKKFFESFSEAKTQRLKAMEKELEKIEYHGKVITFPECPKDK